MSGDLTLHRLDIPPMSETGIGMARSLEAWNALRPQVPVRIEHEFWAGVYARTAYITARADGKATLFTGALIKPPTLLIMEGEALIYVGEDDPVHMSGYNVIRAAAGRKQAFVAPGDLKLTMIFATSATTVAEAEAEFTDELGLLTTRRETA